MKKYFKNHKLWPIYDLQKQILERGGTINRHSDLLAFFEGKSFIPESNAMDVLFSLAALNGKHISKSYENTKDLIDFEFIIYKSEKDRLGFNTIRIKPGSPKSQEFEYAIPDYMKYEIERSKKGYLIKDNEFALRRGDFTQVVMLHERYTDIFRLILNGYNPEIELMKQNKHLLPAIIIAVGLIIASFIYAFANRYYVEKYIVIDKWTGKFVTVKEKK